MIFPLNHDKQVDYFCNIFYNLNSLLYESNKVSLIALVCEER